MKEIENLEKVNMDLVMRSQGSGYLKIPSSVRNEVRRKFGLEIKELPLPSFSFKANEGEKEVIFRFRFDMEEKYDKETKNEYV